MKKWLTWVLVLVCLLALAGCRAGGDKGDPGQEKTGENREQETAVLDGEDAQAGNTQAEVQTERAQTVKAQGSVARIGGGSLQNAVELSAEDAAMIARLLETENWNTGGTSDCIHDCVVTVDGKSVYYHSDCGTFNDEADQRSLSLPEEEQTALNAVLSKYITLGSVMIEDEWGVVLTAKDVTPTGLTLAAAQSGGAPAGELQTGSMFWLETYENGVWKPVPEVPTEDGVERGWNMIAYLIPVDGSVEWEVNWEYLYGTLPAGTYRIGKEIMDFRGTGDYDTRNYYAEFKLTDA